MSCGFPQHFRKVQSPTLSHPLSRTQRILHISRTCRWTSVAASSAVTPAAGDSHVHRKYGDHVVNLNHRADRAHAICAFRFSPRLGTKSLLEFVFWNLGFRPRSTPCNNNKNASLSRSLRRLSKHTLDSVHKVLAHPSTTHSQEPNRNSQSVPCRRRRARRQHDLRGGVGGQVTPQKLSSGSVKVSRRERSRG